MQAEVDPKVNHSSMPVGFGGSSYFDGRALVDTLSRNEVHSISPNGPTTMDALLRLPLPGLDHAFNPVCSSTVQYS